MIRAALLAFALLSACEAPTETAPQAETEQAPSALQQELDRLAAEFGAEHVGIAVLDVENGWTAAVNGERAFPQQSLFKTWVAVAVADAVDRGELDWDERLFVGPDDLDFPYQPIAEEAGPEGAEFAVESLVRRMVTLSDNPSADVLIRRLGGPAAVQAVLEAKGVEGIEISVDERGLHDLADAMRAETEAMDDSEAQAAIRTRLAADPNGATPLGMARGLAALRAGELLLPESTAKILAIHAATETGATRLPAGVPAGWTVAHKTGTGGDMHGLALGSNDAGLISAPDGRTWAVAVFTAGTDRPAAERDALIADVARAIVRQAER